MKDSLKENKTVLEEETKKVLFRLGYPVETQIIVAEACGNEFVRLAGCRPETQNRHVSHVCPGFTPQIISVSQGAVGREDGLQPTRAGGEQL